MNIEERIKNLQDRGWLNSFKPSKRLIKCINGVKSPKQEDIFNAFNDLTPETTKVLILGQDPYPPKEEKGVVNIHAHGYAFSSCNDYLPDSLENIFKAIPQCKKEKNLSEWVKKNNVLLLNTALTHISKEEIENHIQIWKPFIKQVIFNLLTCDNTKLVVFLWGDSAKKKFFDFIKEKKTYMSIKREMLVLISHHPSNSSVNRGGNFPILAPNHFKACNDFLGKNARIKWEDI